MTAIARIRIAIISLAAALILAFAAGWIGYQTARADTTAQADAGIPAPPADSHGSAMIVIPPVPEALPDPVADPVESVSFVVKLWKSGTAPAAIIVGLFLLLTALSRKLKWLQKGYAAIATASLLGGLAMLLERAAAGTTPTLQMFLSALVAAVALALKPTKAPEPAKS